jgi:hypothetical protein
MRGKLQGAGKKVLDRKLVESRITKVELKRKGGACLSFAMMYRGAPVYLLATSR